MSQPVLSGAPVATGGLAAGQRVMSSYGQILRSTALIGGSSLVGIAFSALRMKAIAVMLGPGGVGLMSLYGSIGDLAQTAAGLGLQAAGVRQIAEAAGGEDQGRAARVAAVLRRLTVALGAFGAVLLVLLSSSVSQLTFGDTSHARGIALMAAVVLLGVTASGQLALLQGMRRIGDLARINMLSAMASALIAVPLVYLLGEDGIVPALVSVSVVTLCLSWWFSSRLAVSRPSLTAREVVQEAGEMLKLGLVFMVSGFCTVGTAYVVRLIVLKADGVEAAGLYQAAWAIGGLYAGFILQAMGTDFYPRLTAVASDDAACNRLVNEQARVSMLLAGPGVLATLTVAPLLVALFYSPEFLRAAELLRWLCLGMMLRIVAWPMGFIVLAKGARQVFFWTEIAATAVHVGLAWALVPRIGLEGAGMAFAGLYVWHGGLIYVLVRRMSGFRWSRENFWLILATALGAIFVFAAYRMLPSPAAIAIGVSTTLLSAAWSLRTLLRLFPAFAFRSWVSGFRPDRAHSG